MKIELFSADCKLCERTEVMLKHHFPKTDWIVHRAAECRDGRCCALAEQYGVRAVPSLVVDGQVVLVGLPSSEDLAQLRQFFIDAYYSRQ